MTDTKIILIDDVELGTLDNEETTDIVQRIENLPAESDKRPDKNIGQEDIPEYQRAWDNADVDELERLRAKHPEDARFSLHLSLIDLSADEAQEFSEVNAKHKDLVKDLGLTGAPEFLRLLEEGNAKKTRNYVESLPESNPLKKSMLLLIEYI